MRKLYEIGDLVTIISTRYSGNVEKMIQMIGNTYTIEGIPDSNTLIINNFFWSYRDVKKFHTEKKDIKPEKFDINNLI